MDEMLKSLVTVTHNTQMGGTYIIKVGTIQVGSSTGQGTAEDKARRLRETIADAFTAQLGGWSDIIIDWRETLAVCDQEGYPVPAGETLAGHIQSKLARLRDFEAKEIAEWEACMKTPCPVCGQYPDSEPRHDEDFVSDPVSCPHCGQDTDHPAAYRQREEAE